MRILFLSAALCLSLPVHAVLYKCQDDSGNVTYTNLPCGKNGLKEAKVIAPPPPPAEVPPASPAAAPESPPPRKETPDRERKKSAVTLELMRSPEPQTNKCAKLNDAMGKVMDDMDAARRKGYTQQQESEWNARLKKLQAEKARQGCF